MGGLQVMGFETKIGPPEARLRAALNRFLKLAERAAVDVRSGKHQLSERELVGWDNRDVATTSHQSRKSKSSLRGPFAKLFGQNRDRLCGIHLLGVVGQIQPLQGNS